MKSILAVSGALAVIASISPAEAYPRYYDNIEARPIVRKQVYLSAGSHMFETDDLGPPSTGLCLQPDTFMVVRRPDGHTYTNDNCSSGGGSAPPTFFGIVFPAAGPVYSNKRSCKAGYSRTAGHWTVTVFAAQQQACGRTDLLVDGNRVVDDADFGGTVVAIGVPAGRLYAIDTVHRPAGATDTTIIHFDQSWGEKGFNDDGGIGEAARIWANVGSGDKLVVGSWSPQSQGATALVINDCLFRPDDASYYPGICKNSGMDLDRDNLSDALEAELGTNPLSHDTDRDGLFDYYEVIGRYLDGEEQELRRYGADPLRRDLFVELDRALTSPPMVAMEQAAWDAQVPYYDLPNLPPNPDGSEGISLHFDLGIACADQTLCGDWGGTQDLNLNPLTAMGYDQVRLNMSRVRQGLFHYGFLAIAGAGQGKTNGTSFWATSACVVAHELGHNLGLNHWGASPTDGTHMNYKAAYPSTMNYAFQCSQGTLGRPRFSEGNMASLSHRDLSELSYSPGQSKEHLAYAPFYLTVEGDRVDWNHDGRSGVPGTSGNVAADLAPITRPYLRPGWPDVLDIRDVGTIAPTGGGAIAVAPVSGVADTYQVWAFSPFRVGAQVYPHFGSIVERAGIDPPTPFPAFTAGVPMNGRADGEVTAVMFDMNQGRRILLLFPDTAGVLHYQIFDPKRPLQGTWAPIPGWPSGRRARNASATVAGGSVEVVWRAFGNAPSNAVYSARFSRAGTWSTPRLEQVRSFVTPGIAAAPDGSSYLAVVDDQEPEYIEYYRRPIGSDASWSPVSELDRIRSDLSRITLSSQRTRLQLLFLPHRMAGGQPFPDGTGYLATFWNSGQIAGSVDDWLHERNYSGGYIGPNGSDLFRSRGRMFQKWTDRPYPIHSVAAVRRGDDAAVYFTRADWNTSQPVSPHYIPFASGVAPYETGRNEDTNDAAVLDETMCRSLWDVVYETTSSCHCRFQGQATCAPDEPSEIVSCD